MLVAHAVLRQMNQVMMVLVRNLKESIYCVLVIIGWEVC